MKNIFKRKDRGIVKGQENNSTSSIDGGGYMSSESGNRQDARPLSMSRQDGSSNPGFFSSSSNTQVSGGQFSVAGGHHTNLTININPSGVNSPSEDRLSVGKDNRNAFLQSQKLNSFSDSGIEIPPPRSSDIYYRHLVVKGLGYPLWIPETNNRLPVEYQRRGTLIGDVGIITPEGSFDFLFNICAQASDPINPSELPDNFAPLSPPLNSLDIRSYSDLKANSYLASPSVRHSPDADQSGLTFEVPSAEGAILTIPHGAHSEDLNNMLLFRKYTTMHVENWYRYVNGRRGREARNGDIRLVVGTHKCTAWGMATFFTTPYDQSTDMRLQFTKTGNSLARNTYDWRYNGVADAKTGPWQEEIEKLQEADSTCTGTGYRNQCVFIRTMNVTLRDDIWKRLAEEWESEVDLQDNPSSSRSQFSNSPSADRSSGNEKDSFTGHSHEQRARGERQHLDTGKNISAKMKWHLSVPDLSRNTMDHPSIAIHDMLLAERPNAKMAITEDSAWISVLRENESSFPSPDELCKRIKQDNTLLEDGDAVFTELNSFDPVKSINSDSTWINTSSNYTSRSQSPLSNTTLDDEIERRRLNDLHEVGLSPINARNFIFGLDRRPSNRLMPKPKLANERDREGPLRQNKDTSDVPEQSNPKQFSLLSRPPEGMFPKDNSNLVDDNDDASLFRTKYGHEDKFKPEPTVSGDPREKSNDSALKKVGKVRKVVTKTLARWRR